MNVFQMDRAAVTLPDIDNDDTTNLLVIPLLQEIASDFTLFGYNDVIRRIEEVLTQRGKQRNVMLYGEQGVGKTSVIHGLVQRKNQNDLSTHMYKRTFFRLNSSRLLHTDDVAEINKQFDQVLLEFGRYDTLVIESFYTLVSYLRLRGATVVLVGLLEALSRRKLQAIITCSTREKTLIFTEIPEVHEFFVPEKVVEPTNDELLNILRGVHPSYEARYGIGMTDEAICMTRDLTQKYRNGLEGWAQPGRALTVLDRAIASFSVRMNSRPTELTALETESRKLQNEIASVKDSGHNRSKLEARLADIQPQIKLLRDQWEQTTAPIRKLQKQKADFEARQHKHIIERRYLHDLRSNVGDMAASGKDATTIANEIIQLNRMIDLAATDIARLDDEMAGINLSDQRAHTVGVEHIAQTFSEISNIPPDQLTENERERVLKMEGILAQRVYGQPEAIKLVADAVRRAKAHLSDNEETPKGSFLFLGPSGTGKTELGRALADFESAPLIRIDMSEYMESHAVSRLIGAPPGYAGHDEGGILTKAVHEHPKSIVMLDEIEKAHPDIFKILLQVLGAGRLTDGLGETVDFTETLIIMTSNAGGGYFTDDNLTYEQATLLAMKEVEHFLLPEIRGRLDATVCFHRLDLEMLTKVASKRLDALNVTLLDNHDSTIDISPDDVEMFCKVYRDDRYGGRVIMKALKTKLENDLAICILQEANGGGVYHAKFANDVFAIEFEPKVAA